MNTRMSCYYGSAPRNIIERDARVTQGRVKVKMLKHSRPPPTFCISSVFLMPQPFSLLPNIGVPHLSSIVAVGNCYFCLPQHSPRPTKDNHQEQSSGTHHIFLARPLILRTTEMTLQIVTNSLSSIAISLCSHALC